MISNDVKMAVYSSLKQEVGTGKAVVNGRKLDGAADEGGGVDTGMALTVRTLEFVVAIVSLDPVLRRG